MIDNEIMLSSDDKSREGIKIVPSLKEVEGINVKDRRRSNRRQINTTSVDEIIRKEGMNPRLEVPHEYTQVQSHGTVTKQHVEEECQHSSRRPNV
jgi:hypothetical protein